MSESSVLGPASAGWSDYVGTAAAEDAVAVLGSPSLYELVALDREQWTIVGIDIDVDQDTAVTVYAVDRPQQHLQTTADIQALGEASGQIPVRAFLIPDDQTAAFVEDAFSRLSIRLVAREVRGQSFAVEPTVP